MEPALKTFPSGSLSGPGEEVLEAAVETGVLDALADGAARTPAEIARLAGCDPVGARVLLTALAAMGAAQAADAEGGVTFRLAGPWRTLAGEARDLLRFRLEERRLWRSLAAAVRGGRDAVAGERFLRGGERTEAFYRHVAAMSDGLEEGVRRLGVGGASRLLDVGCGAGVYAAAFLSVYPALSATLVDYAEALPHARRTLAATDLLGRAEIVEGRFFDDSWLPSPGCDLVWLSGVLHAAAPETNASLLARLWGATPPGGRVFVAEMERAGNELESAMFDVELFLGTDSGRVYGGEEIAAMLRGAGFSAVTVESTGEGSVLVRAEKGRRS
ncbi:MAG: methyltransferase domain-containing protein [Planctomycetes bacterium]|nr:methyltransferase domain-containing protein [Planctomycetota bacterium]